MDPKNLNILVVDDVENMRKIVVNMLKELEITKVFQAEDGMDALNTLRLPNVKFDLIILDWMMPQMSGIEVLREIRNDPALAKQPVLMLTAEAEKDSVIEAIKLQVNGYIIKPVTQGKLEEKLNEIIGLD